MKALVLAGQYAQIKLINELKSILDVTQTMDDDEVRAEIRKIADNYNVKITEAQIEQLLKLCRSLEGLDTETLKKRIEGIAESVNKVNNVGNAISDFGKKVENFFVKIGNFFSNLFGNKK